MEQLIDTVAEFTREKYASGTTWYAWSYDPDRLPGEVAAGERTDGDWYARNVELKHRLHAAWKAQPAARANLEHYYIADWGGVRTNKPETLAGYHGADAQANIGRGRTGIASWSKALSVRDPLAFAIFDARVSASLNALQVIHSKRIGQPMRFPVLPSRNGAVSRATVQLRAHFRAHDWPAVRRDFYTDYLKLCKAAAARLGPAGEPLPLYAVEMVLFAHTEELLATAFSG